MMKYELYPIKSDEPVFVTDKLDEVIEVAEQAYKDTGVKHIIKQVKQLEEQFPNGLIIMKDGKKKCIDPPRSGFGEYKIVWKDGKVLDIVKSERVRL